MYRRYRIRDIEVQNHIEEEIIKPKREHAEITVHPDVKKRNMEKYEYLFKPSVLYHKSKPVYKLYPEIKKTANIGVQTE